MQHENYMREALKCAEQGVGRVNPNPLVGALIVRDEKIIARGFHEEFGGLHAERNALLSCSESPRGATMYVTLEPCSHHGKTPPCVDAIIESGIEKVVVAVGDPNPLVAGRGISLLKEAGIEVVQGVLEKEALEQNHVFFHYIQTKMPYVVMKYAMTLDGKTATAQGYSQWITGEQARARVHQDRNRYSAIMVGSRTVLIDDPLLTSRIEGGRNPLRIVCDSQLQTPLESQLVKTAKEVPTIIATSLENEEKISLYEKAGVSVVRSPEKDGHLDLCALMRYLGEQGIDSILLESGGALNWAMLDAGLVNRVQAYIAPKLFGGAEASTPLQGAGVVFPDGAFRLENMKISFEGEDMLVEAEVKSTCLPE